MLTAAELLLLRTGQLHQSRNTFRNSDVKLDRSVAVPRPGDRDLAVPGFERGSCPMNAATWLRRDQHPGVTRLERRDATNNLMHPVGHRAEGVVIEARHLARVDGAVGQHRIPALPDRCRPHRDRIEPGWAFGLEQQSVGVVKMACLGQSMGDERCPREAGLDVVAALARRARRAACPASCSSSGSSSPKTMASAYGVSASLWMMPSALT